MGSYGLWNFEDSFIYEGSTNCLLSYHVEILHQDTLILLLFGNVKLFCVALPKICLCSSKWPKVGQNGNFYRELFCFPKLLSRFWYNATTYEWLDTQLKLCNVWTVWKAKKYLPGDGGHLCNLFTLKIVVLVACK